MRVLILYFTKTGHTLEAATAAAEGIKASGGEVSLVSIKDFSSKMLEEFDALIVASPCWGGSISKREGIAWPLKKVLKSLEPGVLKGKICGGISVHSGAGAEVTVKNIGKILLEKGCKEYIPGPVAVAGVPFSLWKGPSVSHEDIEKFKSFGSDLLRREVEK